MFARESRAFLLGLFAITFSLNAAETRIILKNSVSPLARAVDDGGKAPDSFRISYATLLLKPHPGVEELLSRQQDPSSPDFHRWLTPEQFADRFGASEDEIARVSTWLKTQGFSVHDVARGRHWITFSGNAGQVNKAFHTEIHRYRGHFANSTTLEIPSELQNLVAGVRGLDNFSLAPHYRVKSTPFPAYTTGASHYLAPDDISAIYDLAPLYNAGIDGTGVRIAIIGQTDIDLSDIAAFRSRYNLPQNTPEVILFGADPGTTSDQIEADLDLEWSGAVARNATLIYVNSQDVRLSAQYAIDQNIAPIITFSYGSCEQESLELLRSVAQQANAQGITWMASSGDSGASACDRSSPTPQASKGLTVSYPASIPEITAVGGTEFAENGGNFWGANGANGGSAISYIPEVVWNDSALRNGIVGGGGGASAYFGKPWWQTGPGVPNDQSRDIPDVSLASSADHDGFEMITGGKNVIVGGTSVASPMFAGIVALLNQSLLAKGKLTQPGLGNVNPALYRLAQAQPNMFHDVVSGDNKVQCEQGSPACVNGALGYSAGVGYDLATGLGSVDAFLLVSGWNGGNPATVSLSSTPALIGPSDSVTLVAGVQAAGSPTGTVTFLSGDLNLGTALLTSGTASAKVNGLQIAAGNGAVTALYSGDPIFAPAAATANIPLQITNGVSYIVPSVNPNPVAEFGGQWPYTLTLTQKSQVATTITVFTIDGVDNLPALKKTSYTGLFSVSLNLVGHLAAPATRMFHFAGTDASGATWSADLAVPFVGPSGPAIQPGFTMTSVPSVIQQDSSADPSCQWRGRLVIKETGGFTVALAGLSAGATTFDLTQVFGTSRLAPYGTLTGNLCFSGIVPPATKTLTLLGSADGQYTGGASLQVSFAAPSSSPAAFSASPESVVLTSSGAMVNLTFAGGSPAWSASAITAGDGQWLTVGPSSGTGNGSLNLQANPAGLSNGVYNALVAVHAQDALPQSILIPVVLTVGGSPAISISGANSAAASTRTFAPGMWMAVYGSNLAPSTALSGFLPLPLSLAGTSATVNGVAAPLWFVSPNQINVQVPYETSAGPAILGVNNNGLTAAYPFTVSAAAPGIFDTSLTGKAGQTIVAYISGEGDVTPTLATGTIPKSGTKVGNLPQPRQSLTMTVGGEPAAIAFNGIVTLVGVTQINFTIPADLKPGTYPAVVTVGGVNSPPVKLVVTP